MSRSEAVRRSIDQLPDGYRNVLLIRDIEGYDTEETAALLGLTPGAVKTRLRRVEVVAGAHYARRGTMKLGKAVWRKLRALMMRTLPLMVTCQELEGFMVDYLEGTLPTGQRRTFDWHLRLCPDCWRYLEAYKRTISLSRAACREPDAPVPADVPEELVKAILAARDKKA